MRVKDLRWYILSSIILIFAFAGVSLSYVISIRSGKVNQSMLSITYSSTESYKEIVSAQIDSLYEKYKNDTNDDSVVIDYNYKSQANTLANGGEIKFYLCEQQTALANKTDFTNEVHYVIRQAYKFNPPTTAAQGKQDTDFYVYFQKDKDGSKETTRISLADIFSLTSIKNYGRNTDSNNSFVSNVILFGTYDGDFATETENKGIIKYSSFGSTTDYYQANSYISTYLGDNFESYIETNDTDDTNDDYIKRIITVNGTSYATASVKLDASTFIMLAIPTSEALLGVSWVIDQALVFFFAEIFVMVAMLVIIILGARRASQLLRADRRATEATTAIVIRIDKTGKVIFANNTFKQIYGSGKIISVNDFIDVETNEEILNTIKQNKAFECSFQDTNAETRYLQLTPLYISSSYYLMGVDITQSYLRRKHLEVMSGRNEYTNQENGFILNNQYTTILDENQGYDVAFAEFNVDKHDELISVFGESTFGLILQEILKIIKDDYPDLRIYHESTSKFMVIMPNNDIKEVTDKISNTLSTFDRPITVRQYNVYVKMKVVIFNYRRSEFDNQFNDDGTKKNDVTIETIKTKLDLAYLNMKSLTGKNYLVYEPNMDQTIYLADEMEKDIETGLLNNEFEMYLQPQYDVFKDKIDGFEALIRWHNPKYMDKSPQVFIEIAEQRGHMLDIGKFVITESFKLAKQLEVYHVHVSVNVSPVQLLQVGFVQQLIDEFDKLGLKPGSIAIEITETLLMGNMQLVTEKLKLLRQKGFTIHLDDFCTGYSSMLYLKDLPVDVLKIDKEFTKYIVNNKTHQAIVECICNLGNELGLDLVCEGVETEEQKEMVKKMKCRLIQGYYISKAIPYAEAVELIEKYNN